MFGIKITRFIGWSGQLNPPVKSLLDLTFPTHEKAESHASFLVFNDRFGGIKAEVIRVN